MMGSIFAGGLNPFDAIGGGGFPGTTDTGSAVSGGPFTNRNGGINFGGASSPVMMWVVLAFVAFLLLKAVK